MRAGPMVGAVHRPSGSVLTIETGSGFLIGIKHGMIIGKSPCGRATIERLQMHRPAQVAARLVWLKIGMFG